MILLLLHGTALWAAPLETVRLQLKWRHSFQFAGYYAAREKGFFADEGLDVRFMEFRVGGKNHVRSVLDGDAEYGTADSGLLLRAAGGDPVVWLCQIFQHSPLILISMADSGIFSPYQLAGKRVAFELKSAGTAPIHMMLKNTLGAPREKLRVVPGVYEPEPLMNGEVDAIATYMTDLPFWFKEKGLGVNIINPQNYGIDFYGDNLFTSRREAAERPDRIERMVRATLRGWEYALAHPEEIVDLILEKYNTQNRTKAHLMYGAKMTDHMILKDLIPLGKIDPNRVARIWQTYYKLGAVDKATAPEGLIRGGVGTRISLTAEEEAWLGQNHEIRFSVVGMPPAATTGEDGVVEGFLADFFRHFQEVIGRGVRLVLFTEEDVHGAAGREGVYGTAAAIEPDAPGEKGRYIYSAPYMTTPFIIFVNRDGGAGIRGESDLSGKRVASLASHGMMNDYLSGIGGVTVVPATSPREQLEMLTYGRVDAVAGYSTYHLLIDRYLFHNIEPAFSSAGEYGVGMGINAEHPLLANIMNKAVATLDTNKKQGILAKWGNRVRNDRGGRPVFPPLEREWLAREHTVRVRVSHWPPFMFKKPAFSGMSVDYLKAVAELAGIDVLFVPDERGWAHAVEDVGGAREYYDLLLAATPSPARKEKMAFTDGYLKNPLVVVTRRGDFPVADMEDLAGRSVVVEKGYVLEEILRGDHPEIRLSNAGDTPTALRAVATGKADAYVGNVAVASYLIQAEGLGNLKIACTTAYDDQVLAMGVRKDWAPLGSIISKTMAALPRETRIGIRKRWLSSAESGKGYLAAPLSLAPGERRYLGEKGVVRICAAPGRMPFGRIGADGKYEGLTADYMNLLSSRLEIPFKVTSFESRGEALRALEGGECDLLAGDISTVGIQGNFVSGKPYYMAPMAFAVHRVTPFVGDFHEIAGSRIGVPADSRELDLLGCLYPRLAAVPAADTDAGLRKLAAGEIDGYVDAVAAISHSIRKQGLASVKIGGAIPRSVPFTLLATEEGARLLPLLDRAVGSLTAEDRKAVSERWISVIYEKGVDYTLVIRISLFLLGVLGVVFYRSWVVRRANARLMTVQEELRKKNEELGRLSLTDPLTGLSNRRAAEPVIQREMDRKKRFGHPVSLLILDLDHFKLVNDRHGHSVGDRVLETVAREVSSVLRRTDTMARWGGEEFLILASETGLANAVLLGEKVRKRIEEISLPEAGPVSASLGVAECLPGEGFKGWYERADTALYRAKDKGRNRVEAEPAGSVGMKRGKSSAGPAIRLEWREGHGCGNEVLDRQHEMLFELANEVMEKYWSGEEGRALEKSLERLVDALDAHFKGEEALMEREGFPGVSAHAGEHGKFRGKALNLLSDLRNGAFDAALLMEFLVMDLLAGHMSVGDRAFTAWMADRG